MRRTNNLWWKTFWIGVAASLAAALLWAIVVGSSRSSVRLRLEFERAPAATQPEREVPADSGQAKPRTAV
jgi:hypothetical protein